MNQEKQQLYQYQVGGSLPTNAPTYVKREADEQLYQALKEGDFCYVLNSRQMGKSSLRVQTMQRLQSENFACVAIDITNIGTTDISPEQWYAGIIDTIINSLELYDNFDLNDWWMQQDLLSPVNKLSKFFESVLLPSISQNIVIFIDEIDSVLSLKFEVDDFFALIRECYNSRASQPEYERLTFVLLGVANPRDLIQDKGRTPFNIGKAIELTGFQLNEAEPLAQGLAEKTNDPMALMDEILYWTGGQPFLTQKLCKLILNHEAIPEDGIKKWLRKLVQSQIINDWEAQDDPEHLKTIRDRILRTGGGQLAGRLLAIYREVLWGGQFSPVRTADTPEQVYLRLSGLVVEQQGNLRVYNHIYKFIFNLDWVNQELKDLRPDFYTQPFEAWFNSNCEDNSHLLQGEKLSDALAWAEGKSLSNQDYQFISASQKWEFAQTRKRTKRQIRIGLIVLAALLGFAGVPTVWGLVRAQEARWAQEARDTAIADQNEAKEVLTQVKQKLKEAQESLKEAEKREKKALEREEEALGREEEAQKGEKKAQKGLKEAQEREKKAQVQTKKAQAELGKAQEGQKKAQAQTKKAQAEQKKAQEGQKKSQTQTKKAQAELGKAQEGQRKAQAQTKKAQAELGKAQAEKTRAEQDKKIAVGTANNARKQARLAREGMEPERLAREALQEFNYDKTLQVVVKAMDAGNQLQKTVKELPLEEYPTITPLLALNTVLDIPERQTFKVYKEEVSQATVSADGKFIVTASDDDNKAKVWDINGNLLQTLEGHRSKVTSAAFSPDGKRIVTASNDNTARVWDINGNLLQTLEGHTEKVNHAAFSPDGKRIVTASDDRTAKVWDINTGNQLTTLHEGYNAFKKHQGSVNHAAFSSDGKSIVTASSDKTAKVWDINGNLLQTLDGHREQVNHAAFSPDGKLIVTASSDNTVRVWDINTGKLRQILKGHQNWVLQATFSPDGKRIVTVSRENTARVWDINGNLLQTLDGHQGFVKHATFISQDGNRIVTASNDNTVKVWDINDKEPKTLPPERNADKGHRYWVVQTAFSLDGQRIVTASHDNTAKVWDINGNLLQSLEGHQNIVTSAAFSPVSAASPQGIGQRIVTASHDKTARVWDINGKLLHTLEGHTESLNHATFSPDGKRIVTGSLDGTARLWDINGKLLHTLEGHEEQVNHVAFSPVSAASPQGIGQRIVTASNDNTARVWDINGKLLHTLEGHKEQVNHIAFSPDGQRIVTASHDKTARVWDINGKLLQTLKGHQNWVMHAAFSPDSQRIVTSSIDKTARVWKINGKESKILDGKDLKILNEKEPEILRGHQGWVLHASFSPDGQRIVTASGGNTAQVWDINGRLLRILKGHQDFVRHAAFSPDGKNIITASHDGTAKVWRVESLDELLKRGCDLLEDHFVNHSKEDRARAGCPAIQN